MALTDDIGAMLESVTKPQPDVTAAPMGQSADAVAPLFIGPSSKNGDANPGASTPDNVGAK